MDYDAMGVGNHEFDDGRSGLLPFAQEAGFPLLAANLNVSAFPEIDAWIDSATILDVQGKHIYGKLVQIDFKYTVQRLGSYFFIFGTHMVLVIIPCMVHLFTIM